MYRGSCRFDQGSYECANTSRSASGGWLYSQNVIKGGGFGSERSSWPSIWNACAATSPEFGTIPWITSSPKTSALCSSDRENADSTGVEIKEKILKMSSSTA